MFKFFLPVFCMLFLGQCNKATFIAEPYDSRLPIFTEQGYNISGCYINDTAYRSPSFCTSNNCYELTKVSNNQLRFSIIGLTNPTSRQNTPKQINFYLTTDKAINEKLKIETLKGKTFSLDNSNKSYATFTNKHDLSPDDLKSFKGKILFVNSEHEILAGTFYFEIQDSTSVTKFTSGRFDFSRFN